MATRSAVLAIDDLMAYMIFLAGMSAGWFSGFPSVSIVAWPVRNAKAA